MATLVIWRRNRHEVNTDPQRRCYNGCHASSELRWGPWETIESGVPEHRVEGKLKFWRELNAYAVSQRGSSAYTEYRALPEGERP